MTQLDKDNSMVNINMLTDKEKQGLVCMYFARLSKINPEYSLRHEYFKKLSDKFGKKVNSLKNDKDAFDANFSGNDRVGWTDKSLEQRSKLLADLFNKYGNISLEEHKRVVDEIISKLSMDEYRFFSIKTKNPVTVAAILKKDAKVEIEGINILKAELTLNQLVFLVLGGDKPSWDTGLIGLGSISQLPYDEGYEGKNYKIKIDVKVLLDKPIKREDLVPYKETYDIIGIGPITKWEPNQAISQVNEKKGVALMRAMLELCPGIQEDLSVVIDDRLMDRVKGATVKLVPQAVDYGEAVKMELDEDDIDVIEDTFVALYAPDIEAILNGFEMDEKPVVTMKNFINSGKHIIMTGPPGTGKTTLAERACEAAVSTHFVSGYTITTAISDWSTFDTIGGYMPDKNSNLSFQEGIFLKSIRENKWLIIDEINRAEVDKSFGHFFTVLAGKNVELQFEVAVSETHDQNISIKHSSALKSYYDDKTATYYIGKNWRIIATMNTYDKNSLFMLSYAFMRRFAFVYIPAPTDSDFSALIKSKLDGQEELSITLIEIIKASPKKMGAAIIIDLIAYLESSNFKNLVDGICSLIIPQYEGISLPQIKQLFKDFKARLSNEDKMILQNYLCEFFEVKANVLSPEALIDDEIIE